MANIRVKCPTCQTDLEIDAEFEGQEVECGNCLQVFVAQSASSSSSGSRSGASSRRRDDDDDDDRPKRKKKKRRRDDDDDYEHDYDDDYYDSPRRSGSGTALRSRRSFGILSIPTCFCCFLNLPLSIGAIITGAIGMKNPEGKGMAVGGLICGIIGLVLFIAGIIIRFAVIGMDKGGGFR